MRNTLLNKVMPVRREFNPESEQDLCELHHFLRHGRWKTSCPFWEEGNWTEIPAMCLNKYALHTLELKLFRVHE